MPSTDQRTGKPATTAGQVAVLALVALTAAGAGCKSIQPATTGSGGSGGSGNNGSGGSGNDASVEQVAIPDMAAERFMSGDMMNNDGQCAATTSQAMLVPLDLYVMMDSSKSMNETDSAGNPKWTDLKKAMANFFSDQSSQGFNVALTYFPDEQSGVPEVCNSDSDCGSNGPCDQRKACVGSTQFSTAPSTLCAQDSDCVTAGDGDSCVAVQTCPRDAQCNQRNCVQGPKSTGTCPSGCVPFTGYCRGRDICDPNDYAMPKVSFGALSDSSVVQKLNDSLNNHSPGGYTPTGPALSGALKAAQQNAKDNPDHKTVVVLLTDGLPGAFIPGKAPATCTPADVPGVASLLMTGATGDPANGVPPIQTFIIGVFGPCDLTDKNVNPQTNLDSWAAAGGTMTSVIVDTSQDVTSKILDAFKKVQSTVITCQYAVPKNVSGGIDFMKVNVDFSSSAMTMPEPVHYVGSKDNCDSTSGGWYYDVDPSKTAPTQIIACDKSCSDFKAAAGAKVEVALGCATIN